MYTAKRQYRKFETNIPRKGIARPQSQFHIHVSVSDLYIPVIGPPILLQENTRGPIPDIWMWKMGLKPCNSFSGNTLKGFSVQCTVYCIYTLRNKQLCSFPLNIQPNDLRGRRLEYWPVSSAQLSWRSGQEMHDFYYYWSFEGSPVLPALTGAAQLVAIVDTKLQYTHLHLRRVCI
jgi:hypothetical protein